MPEIAEVARTVHFLRQNLLGKTLKTVTAAPDDIVFGKVGTSAQEIEKSLTGRKVIDVGQQGKYFWMIMDKPPHPVMHFGMSGWFRFRGQETFYYKGREGKDGVEQWPPKFWKFHMLAVANGKESIEAAFVDMRRLGRIRLVHCEGKAIRQNSPLKENGPDPVIDPDVLTVSWLQEVCNRKKVPIKAMLLDQAVISGIGNWVGDEVLFHSRIHPEQYANTLKDSQIKQLHKSIHYVCKTACDLLADSDKFPQTWLFKHRWGKRKKSSTNTLPTGEKIVFLTVGGRTSAVVPSIQKKTGPVAKEVNDSESEAESGVVPDKKGLKASKKTAAPKKTQGTKRKASAVDEADQEGEVKNALKRVTRSKKAKEEAKETFKQEEPKTTSKAGSKVKRKTGVKASSTSVTKSGQKIVKAGTGARADKAQVKVETESGGRRRSGRTRKSE